MKFNNDSVDVLRYLTENNKINMNNIFAYKTTVLGILAFVTVLVAGVTEFLTTGTISGITITAFIGAFFNMLGLGVARDYNSSDKNEGLK